MPDVIFTMDNGSSYLAHYGVKGMKWGVRRYRNEDGSVTPEGKRHAKLSDSTKRKLKTAAIGLGTAAAVGGGVYLARKAGLKATEAARLAKINDAKATYKLMTTDHRNDLKKLYAQEKKQSLLRGETPKQLRERIQRNDRARMLVSSLIIDTNFRNYSIQSANAYAAGRTHTINTLSAIGGASAAAMGVGASAAYYHRSGRRSQRQRRQP